MNCPYKLRRHNVHASASGPGRCLIFPLTSQWSTSDVYFSNLCWLAVTDSLLSLYFGLDEDRWCNLTSSTNINASGALGDVLLHQGILQGSPRSGCNFTFGDVVSSIGNGAAIAFVSDSGLPHANLLVGYLPDPETVIIFDPESGLDSRDFVNGFCPSAGPVFFTSKPQAQGVIDPIFGSLDGSLIEVHKEFMAINEIGYAGFPVGFQIPSGIKRSAATDLAIDRLLFAGGNRESGVQISEGLRVDIFSSLAIDGISGSESVTRYFVGSGGALVGVVDVKEINGLAQAVGFKSGRQVADLWMKVRAASANGTSKNISVLDYPGLSVTGLLLEVKGAKEYQVIPVGRPLYGLEPTGLDAFNSRIDHVNKIFRQENVSPK
jgi:hypothetical protein